MEGKIRKDEAAWKKQLTSNQYYVTRQKGTEPPFTGEYEDTDTPGVYKCVCCGQRLFPSDTKYHPAPDGEFLRPGERGGCAETDQPWHGPDGSEVQPGDAHPGADGPRYRASTQQP